MGTYTTRNKITKEVVSVGDAANVIAARAAAAAMLFEVTLSTSQEILDWGKSGKDIAPANVRAKKAPFVGPAQTDLVSEIKPETAGESGDLSHVSLDETPEPEASDAEA